ncbi:MAG: M2 family metallopeptidase [Planctomycetaceae bacterium]|nr:M2 family metallopeptidase [Planctomycetaceae bacterium]
MSLIASFYAAQAVTAEPPMTPNAAAELSKFLHTYQNEALELFKASAQAEWEAMTTGKDEAFEKSAGRKLAWAKYHSDPQAFAKIKELRKAAVSHLDLQNGRAAQQVELQYAQNQLPEDLQKKMIDMSAEIEKIFQNQRPKLDGKEYTNNDLLEKLGDETDSLKRQKIWEALKQAGSEVADKVTALAKVRNEAARKLGFKNYWEMQVVFQDYQPEDLLSVFKTLEETTRQPFAEMKKELDGEIAAKFNVSAESLMPWHYDNPFFQQAPPSKDVDPNDFYKDKTKEEIIAIAVRYYESIGLPYKNVLSRSDMFERSGKNQHAFSIDMDTLGDVRNLCNVKATDEWMDTVLHEGGHGVYSLGIDRTLPFVLRQEAHIFATEGVAMLFGAKSREAEWMIAFAGADAEKAGAAAKTLKKQRIREQLIFCRWTIVMLNFEKLLYENPDADLKNLWWDIVEKYQLLKRPVRDSAGNARIAADWASKPHFVIAPVYYHNYMLGELFAAQIRQSLGTKDGKPYDGKDFGKALQEKVFAPGKRYDWKTFVEQATGEPLSPRAFAKELK